MLSPSGCRQFITLSTNALTSARTSTRSENHSQSPQNGFEENVRSTDRRTFDEAETATSARSKTSKHARHDAPLGQSDWPLGQSDWALGQLEAASTLSSGDEVAGCWDSRLELSEARSVSCLPVVAAAPPSSLPAVTKDVSKLSSNGLSELLSAYSSPRRQDEAQENVDRQKQTMEW